MIPQSIALTITPQGHPLITIWVKKSVNIVVFCQSVFESFVSLSLSHTCSQFRTFRVIKKGERDFYKEICYGENYILNYILNDYTLNENYILNHNIG